MENFATVREEIKKVLKVRKVRYGQLAKQMGLSESGVKKMLNGKDLSFNKICTILSAAGVNVSEFFKILEEAPPQEMQLTDEQENFFIKSPESYNFFHQLLQLDLDTKALKQRHALSQQSVDKYLHSLDKIGAIELHPDNVIKSDFAGNCRMTFGVPLLKQVADGKHRTLLNFAHIPNPKFRGRKYLVNGTLSLKSKSASEFIAEMKDLVGEFMKRSDRETAIEPTSAREDIGFLFLITPTEGLPHEVIPNI